MRNCKRLGPTVATIILFSATVALSVPIWVRDDPSHPLNNIDKSTEPGNEPAAATDESAEPSVYDAQSGDSVYFLCDKGIITFDSGYGGSDCWGWRHPDGTEYAIMGIHSGLAFVNTATMMVADLVPGPVFGCGGTRWRDMKTYQHYCYAVSECTGTNEGLMVVDMQYLPDSVKLIGAFAHNNLGDPTSHNLSIDTVTGYAYTEGSGFFEGLSIHIVSLADPESPSYVNSFGIDNGIHDIYAVRDTVFVAEGSHPSFSIWDVSNKLNPVLLSRVFVPASGYQHNIWPTADLQYAVTTEETQFKTVKVWDVSDLGNVQLAGEYLGSNGLAHNAQVKGDRIYLSHYEAGVTVVDMSNPFNPVEIAAYDTWPTDNPDYNGCWGAFPYTSNNLVYGSNLNNRLYVLEEIEAVLFDTIRVETVEALPGSKARIDVYAVNSIPIRKFFIPLTWAGPTDLSFDSVSTAGLRTEYFEQQSFSAFDLSNDRIVYLLESSQNGTSPDLPPGSGPILSLYLGVPPSAQTDTNLVTLLPFNGKELAFVNGCLRYLPDSTHGALVVDATCCDDIRGNVDGDPGDEVNVADLSYLVDYLFLFGPVPPCFEEANVDGDVSVSVADLSYLVDYLFLSGPAPLSCP